MRIPSPTSVAGHAIQLEKLTSGLVPGSVEYLARVAQHTKSPTQQVRDIWGMTQQTGREFIPYVAANWTLLRDGDFRLPVHESASALLENVWWWGELREYGKFEFFKKEVHQAFVVRTSSGPWAGVELRFKADRNSYPFDMMCDAVLGARRDKFEDVRPSQLVGKFIRFTVRHREGSGGIPQIKEVKSCGIYKNSEAQR